MNTPRRPQRPIDPLLQQHDGRTRNTLPPPTPGARPQERTTSPHGTAPTDAHARLAALSAARGNTKPSPTAGKAGRRAKPARAAKLASLALSAVTTIGLAGVFAGQDGSTDSIQLTTGTAGDPLITAVPATTTAEPTATTAATIDATIDATTDSTTDATTDATTVEQATTVAPATTAGAVAGVVDGTYVGAGDTNRWGTVQVQVVYSGGQISDVQILRYPDGDRKSVRINEAALPTLISEAITTQQADVSTVSGATYTSVSYRISLQSAIDAAKAASGISG